ncbi:Uncharacterised protein [Yersinia intermedia]|uniref:hypothetical protein n=1 Tax=Yersinia intermedia TaxID=631 RepID=UPI0005EA4578|nr:hypothetical protein [Yersinia intermedia]CQE12723.1 Uncharacterised protein [Yersinia intermedia]
MNANLPILRSARTRVFSKHDGFREVRFPVRTPEDLRELDALKEMQLNRFVMALFKEAQEEYRFSPGVFTELVKAMLEKDSPGYITAHGAFGHFNTQMFEYGLAEEVGAAVEIYIACYPTSADYVMKSIPAKVLNYLCKYANTSDVMKWTEANPQWKENVIASLKAGTFSEQLKMMRMATGAMSVNFNFLQMLEKLVNNASGINPEAMEQAQKILANAPNVLYQSPREWSESCNELRGLITYFILVDLESRYGDMTNQMRTYTIPFYNKQREMAGKSNSQVISFEPGTLLAEHFDYGICIGWRYDSWEQFFYQLCHECVHLLDPQLAPNGELKVSALDEGVAVRYAEEMLDKYLPYIARSFVDSPVISRSPYYFAWDAARKLPDEVLRTIRETFGAFARINDRARFAQLTSKWLNEDEITLLCADFEYPKHR